MIQFDPNAVYSCAELEERLQDTVSLETFLKKLGVPRRFNGLVLGSDIVKALQNPPESFDTIIPGYQQSIKRGPGRPRKGSQVAVINPIALAKPIRLQDVIDKGAPR